MKGWGNGIPVVLQRIIFADDGKTPVEVVVQRIGKAGAGSRAGGLNLTNPSHELLHLDRWTEYLTEAKGNVRKQFPLIPA